MSPNVTPNLLGQFLRFVEMPTLEYFSQVWVFRGKLSKEKKGSWQDPPLFLAGVFLGGLHFPGFRLRVKGEVASPDPPFLFCFLLFFGGSGFWKGPPHLPVVFFLGGGSVVFSQKTRKGHFLQFSRVWAFMFFPILLFSCSSYSSYSSSPFFPFKFASLSLRLHQPFFKGLVASCFFLVFSFMITSFAFPFLDDISKNFLTHPLFHTQLAIFWLFCSSFVLFASSFGCLESTFAWYKLRAATKVFSLSSKVWQISIFLLFLVAHSALFECVCLKQSKIKR